MPAALTRLPPFLGQRIGAARLAFPSCKNEGIGGRFACAELEAHFLLRLSGVA
jgi:hypothetical protein